MIALFFGNPCILPSSTMSRFSLKNTKEGIYSKYLIY
ncbi:hypothetical protein KP509_39G048400 [Ceratopteris richardii]|uniref:Uncharacterized protein n=1 Tax=Ceratopteris richardii TaxID=49495 RepID=A0A8T2Q0U5_CERRI|nr:hypothetical protein KP509_39G048400 [Ceratopteris richardii]